MARMGRGLVVRRTACSCDVALLNIGLQVGVRTDAVNIAPR